ncbi:PREDICTED: RNA-directed DNA polymerase from mobile element jockey-like [Habropoda laboriosa]|uniref:RNA-directed DNA polymerase from mobile element jockey-like n=1 Tax=Habropoda laboriosa TaxID=597456 RepID=UPI00083D90D8|nr:PREDICTED: RNA-directed DNA polymerase from mobile element jockey-like [Habropoda laboriosa]
MDYKLKIAIWNANGLHQRLPELKTFLSINKIDIMLVAEAHLTDKNYMKIPLYNIYTTNHPAGNKFIAVGDYIAKHALWGSKTNSPRGKTLEQTIRTLSLDTLTTNESTYWPAAYDKSPDLLDFGIIKGLNKIHFQVHSCFDLSSDHSPILLDYLHQPVITQAMTTLCNNTTNWAHFKNYLEVNINCNIPLKTPEQIESAVINFTNLIQEAGWMSTKPAKCKRQFNSYPEHIIQKIKLKHNAITKEVKQLILQHCNDEFHSYIYSLSPNEDTNYSLWKATKRFKRPTTLSHAIKKSDGSWARNAHEKATVFAEHLYNTFQSNDNHVSTSFTILTNTDYNQEIPRTTVKEVKNLIAAISIKKTPGFDLINRKIIKELPPKAVRMLTIIFNAILRTQYFPINWKIAQIIMLHKPDKNLHLPSCYRPIPLLFTPSKILEKTILTRMKQISIEQNLIPSHQFGFRNKHATMEQIHRLRNKITHALEHKQYCTAHFLDIEKAFDKVWHEGLLHKIDQKFPKAYYKLIKSYLKQRTFFVKYLDECYDIYDLEAGVPQGSVLGPFLYILYTADIPTVIETDTFTFADDTAILSAHNDPKTAYDNLQ